MSIVQGFLGRSSLPTSMVSPIILNHNGMATNILSENDANYFNLLENANNTATHESKVDDYARYILEMLHFPTESGCVHTQREMYLTICRKLVSKKTDIALVKVSGYYQFVLFCKRTKYVKNYHLL